MAIMPQMRPWATAPGMELSKEERKSIGIPPFIVVKLQTAKSGGKGTAFFRRSASNT
jgi:hypothetical protein